MKKYMYLLIIEFIEDTQFPGDSIKKLADIVLISKKAIKKIPVFEVMEKLLSPGAKKTGDYAIKYISFVPITTEKNNFIGTICSDSIELHLRSIVKLK